MRYIVAALVASMLTGTLGVVSVDQRPVPLFDGKSLAGWVPEHTDRFSVRDGLIVQQGGTGWLRSEKTYQSFELHAEFRTRKAGAESGILFRTSRESDSREPYWPAKGYQLQISDGEGNLVLLGHGIMPPRFERNAESLKAARKAAGEWQKIVLKVSGPTLEASLNGLLITKSSSLELQGGHLGLLGKNGSIQWRELRMREDPKR
jgi:hypothetical protein